MERAADLAREARLGRIAATEVTPKLPKLLADIRPTLRPTTPAQAAQRQRQPVAVRIFRKAGFPAAAHSWRRRICASISAARRSCGRELFGQDAILAVFDARDRDLATPARQFKEMRPRQFDVERAQADRRLGDQRSLTKIRASGRTACPTWRRSSPCAEPRATGPARASTHASGRAMKRRGMICRSEMLRIVPRIAPNVGRPSRHQLAQAIERGRCCGRQIARLGRADGMKPRTLRS